MNPRVVIAATAIVYLLSAGQVFAQSIVRPSQAATSSSQIFRLGSLNKREMALTGIRIVLPEGLSSVAPSVKPGWTIEVKHKGAEVGEIIWSGGVIPPGQRDDFSFSADVPAVETTLVWKAYETYADGSVVAWERPEGEATTDMAGPYSQTKISTVVASSTALNAEGKAKAATSISIVAGILALAALFYRSKK